MARGWLRSTSPYRCPPSPAQTKTPWWRFDPWSDRPQAHQRAFGDGARQALGPYVAETAASNSRRIHSLSWRRLNRFVPTRRPSVGIPEMAVDAAIGGGALNDEAAAETDRSGECRKGRLKLLHLSVLVSDF